MKFDVACGQISDCLFWCARNTLIGHLIIIEDGQIIPSLVEWVARSQLVQLKAISQTLDTLCNFRTFCQICSLKRVYLIIFFSIITNISFRTQYKVIQIQFSPWLALAILKIVMAGTKPVSINKRTTLSRKMTTLLHGYIHHLLCKGVTQKVLVNFPFFLFQLEFVCICVAMCDLVHDVESVHGICQLLKATRS